MQDNMPDNMQDKKHEKKKKQNKKKKSITAVLAITMASLIAATVLAGLLLNMFFLERYYVKHKTQTIQNAYMLICDASEEEALNSTDFDVAIERISANDNVAYMILSADGTVVKTSANNSEDLRNQFFDAIFSPDGSKGGEIANEDNYVIRKQRDTRLDSEYLVLWGTLPDGDFIMIRSALESIHESAKIANQFLSLVGVATCILAIVVAICISRKLTKPLVELKKLSTQMAQLDFDASYTGNSTSEVDDLGENMNLLSEKLKETIQELKNANNELQLDNQRKTEIDEMRKEFLSNVSHELKTPLALILGYAEGLKDCINEDEESRNFYCDVIMDEAEKMNRMVKKLLSLNQLEFGKDVVELKRFELTELIRGVLQSSKLLMEQGEITLTTDFTSPIYVWGDEFKIEEVLTNYISNAIHYCDGKKEIAVKAVTTDEKVHVTVFNTGKQIPEDDLDKVWQKFYKVDKARTREYGGSGIGLSIVKAIMTSHNEAFGVENNADGVTFWFELSVA